MWHTQVTRFQRRSAHNCLPPRQCSIFPAYVGWFRSSFHNQGFATCPQHGGELLGWVFGTPRDKLTYWWSRGFRSYWHSVTIRATVSTVPRAMRFVQLFAASSVSNTTKAVPDDRGPFSCRVPSSVSSVCFLHTRRVSLAVTCHTHRHSHTRTATQITTRAHAHTHTQPQISPVSSCSVLCCSIPCRSLCVCASP